MLSAFLDGALFGASTGEGPTRVVALHGWRRTHEDFSTVAADLAARGCAVTSVDLPGFGATPAPPKAMGALGYAEVLAPLIEQIAEEAGPPVVLGHSFGGRIATCLAAGHPDLVGSLILTGVPLVRSALPSARPSRRYQLVRTAARWHLVSEERLEASRRRHGSADYRAATGVMRDVLVAQINESYEEELAALRCEVSLVWGALDTTTPVVVAERARDICVGATLTVLDGVGHLVPTEAPGPLVTATLGLLGAHG